MSSNKVFLSRSESSNGDSSNDEDEYDVFENSRLDMSSPAHRLNQEDLDDSGDGLRHAPHCFLNFKMNERSPIPALFSPSPGELDEAVIFSVHFRGKYYGEVGLFEPDISVLDWVGFRSYIFSSLNLESFDSYVISYCDEEGKKVPINSEVDYQEALKLAKLKNLSEGRLPLHISRVPASVSGSSGLNALPSSLRSLASSLRRVNSTNSNNSNTNKSVAALPASPKKKDVTTSTSFHSFEDHLTSSYVAIPTRIDLSSPHQDYFEDPVQLYDKGDFYDCLQHPTGPPQRFAEFANEAYFDYSTSNNDHWEEVNAPAHHCSVERQPESDVPRWFNGYMKKFREDLKEDLSLEVSSKINERFAEAVGNFSASEVEDKLRTLITGYSDDLQNKVICCCKAMQACPPPRHSEDHLPKPSLLDDYTDCPTATMVTPTPLRHFGSGDPLLMEADANVGPNTQDYFLQKLLRREEEILDFLDNTNEKIKRKISIGPDEDYDSIRSCLTKELAIEERERVLNRIEDFRRRQSRTNLDIRMLQQSMDTNSIDNILRLPSQIPPAPPAPMLNPERFSPPPFYDAKFMRDENFSDGSRVFPDQVFCKHWTVQNTGIKPWDDETFLICQSYHLMKPFSEKILCPPLLPGDVGRISADFRAPMLPGIYSTDWRFAHNDMLFGNHLWCSVIVPPDPITFQVNSQPKLQCLSTEESIPDTINIDIESDDVELNAAIASSNFSRPSRSWMQGRQSLSSSEIHAKTMSPQDGNMISHMNVSSPSKIDLDLAPRCDQFFSNPFDEFSAEKLILETSEQLQNLNPKELVRYLLLAVRVAKPDLTLTRRDRETRALRRFLETADLSAAQKAADDTVLRRLISKGRCEEASLRAHAQLFPSESQSPEARNNLGMMYTVISLGEDEREEPSVEIISPVADFLINLDGSIHDEAEWVEAVDSDESLCDSDDSDVDVEIAIEVGDGEDNSEDDDVVVVNGFIDNDSDDSRESVASEENDKDQNEVSQQVEESSSDEESELSSADSDDDNEPQDNYKEESIKDEGVESVTQDESDSEDENEALDDAAEAITEALVSQFSNCQNNFDAQEDQIEGSEIVDESSEEEEEEINVIDLTPPPPPEDLEKEITCLRENFKQNVQVNLDFEVIQKSPEMKVEIEGPSTTNVVTLTDPLTFQEKHFTFSSRPPPIPVQVPDSDDESFDGLVFIRDCDVASSVPPTDPSSPCSTLPPDSSVAAEMSASCSFSDIDGEGAKDENEDNGDTSSRSSSASDFVLINY